MKITLNKLKAKPFSLLNKGDTFRTFRLPASDGSKVETICMKLAPEGGRGRYVSLSTGEIWYTPDIRLHDDLSVIPVHVEATATDIT